jgi:hypothetical protein
VPTGDEDNEDHLGLLLVTLHTNTTLFDLSVAINPEPFGHFHMGGGSRENLYGTGSNTVKEFASHFRKCNILPRNKVFPSFLTNLPRKLTISIGIVAWG